MFRTYNDNIKISRGFSLISRAILALILILVFTVACSDNEDSLKIVIEDSPTAVTPKTIDPPPDGTPPLPPPLHAPSPIAPIDIAPPAAAPAAPPTAPPTDIAPEPRPVPDAATPPTIGGPESTPEPSTTTNALTMSPLDVMLKLSDNEDYKRITSNLPVRIVIHGLPQNMAWGVNVMFQKIKLMGVVVDDNTGDVIRRDVQKEHSIRTLAKKMKHSANEIKKFISQLNLGYAGALGAALSDERFPNIDNTKRITIIVLLGRGGNKPVWHVVYVPGEGKPNVIATIDDSGNVMSVEEETKGIKK